MLQAERFQRIEGLLTDKNLVSVAELEKELSVSRATIYRDMKELHRAGKIRIVRGGIAMPLIPSPLPEEFPYEEKARTNAEEKARIAEYAAEMIEPGSTIFLDSSTTVLNLCPHIMKKNNILIITNDVRIAVEFSPAFNISVYVIGGHLRHNYYTLTDRAMEERLREIAIDTAFFSCDAITPRHGCMITNDDEVPLKKFILTHTAQRSIMLADHSKFNRTAFMSFANISDFSKIITGRELSDELYQAFHNVSPNLIRI